jgi:predicted alpha/beta superfamily hydrolase
MHQHEQGTDYFNCGSWIDAHPAYITVGEEGVQIHEYVERTDDLHPAQEQSEEQNPADSEPADFGDEAGFVEDGEYEGVAT